MNAPSEEESEEEIKRDYADGWALSKRQRSAPTPHMHLDNCRTIGLRFDRSARTSHYLTQREMRRAAETSDLLRGLTIVLVGFAVLLLISFHLV